MSLHFGICWIEDQASNAEVQAVEAAVKASGFEPKITRIERAEEIETFAAHHIHHQDYDLILLDLTLGRGLRGDELAQQVRDAFRSTPILFYSAVDEAQLREKMAAQRVEGVYCVHRVRLAGRVGELVAHLSPALNRLSSMRGLAARVVAECDQDFRAILAHLGHGGLGPEIAASLKVRVKEAAAKQGRDVEAFDTLEDLLGSHAVHSGALFMETRDRAAAVGGDEVRDVIRGLRRGYPANVLGRRNTLSHALEEPSDMGGWKISRTGANPVTVADFARYRRDFLTQLGLVRRLREILIAE